MSQPPIVTIASVIQHLWNTIGTRRGRAKRRAVFIDATASDLRPKTLFTMTTSAVVDVLRETGFTVTATTSTAL